MYSSRNSSNIELYYKVLQWPWRFKHEVLKSHVIVTDSIKQDQYNAKMHIFNFWIEKVIKKNHVVYLKRKKDRNKCKYFILILIHEESLHAYMYKFFSLSDADKKLDTTLMFIQIFCTMHFL